jgi:hypothetical protein
MGFFRAVSARVSISPSEDGSPDPSVAGPSGRRIPVRLFLARSREPAAGRDDSDKWLENRGAGLGIRDTGANPGHGKCSDE